VDRMRSLGQGRESSGGTSGLKVSPDLEDDFVWDLHWI
jgi:hypothetical protein